MSEHAGEVHDAIRCPLCRGWMQAGYVSITQGMLWLRNPDASSMHFAEAVPGTHAVMRPNRLPAWRCQACGTITFRYGRDKRAAEVGAGAGASG